MSNLHLTIPKIVLIVHASKNRTCHADTNRCCFRVSAVPRISDIYLIFFFVLGIIYFGVISLATEPKWPLHDNHNPFTSIIISIIYCNIITAICVICILLIICMYTSSFPKSFFFLAIIGYTYSRQKINVTNVLITFET